MNQTVIPFDTKKRLKNLLLGIVLLAGGAIFTYYDLFVADRIEVIYAALSIMVTVAALIMIVIAVRDLLRKDKAGLILDAEGISFRGTPVGRKAGHIAWRDIIEITEGKVSKEKFLFLKLADPSKYLNAVSATPRKIPEERGVPVGNSELEISFREMRELIERYYAESRQPKGY